MDTVVCVFHSNSGGNMPKESRNGGLRYIVYIYFFFYRIQFDNERFDPGDVLSLSPLSSPLLSFLLRMWVSDAHLLSSEFLTVLIHS